MATTYSILSSPNRFLIRSSLLLIVVEAEKEKAAESIQASLVVPKYRQVLFIVS